MDKQAYQTMLKSLEHVQRRPHMYFSQDVPAVANFLTGFRVACMTMGFKDFDLIYKRVVAHRGWQLSSQAVWTQMQAQGFDDEAIIQELLAIHIAVVEQFIPETTENKE